VNDKFISIASDRISAFDHILPKSIPHKGQVLNQIAAHFLSATKDIVPNWLLGMPDPNVSVGLSCEPIRIEMVIRGYLVGHAWREYKAGKRVLCGVKLKEGMKENQRFDAPIITPATKAPEGHDEDISREEILNKGLASSSVYKQIEEYTHALFERGQQMADERGLILVDTKYEFGTNGDDIYLIDEIHTPDSSRYFFKESYEDNLQKGRPQVQLSKEFVREWLISEGFQGLPGQKMPYMSDEIVETISKKYIQLYEILIDAPFESHNSDGIKDRIFNNLISYLEINK
jgi:phosphoribosylaminoimidazole-succinocarboxamide synthase